MSYFALAKSIDGKPFEVKRCHINLWSLPGVIQRRMYFDLGIHLRALDGGLKKFDIALPFVAESLVDVSTCLEDPATSTLIFRRPSSNHRVSLSKDIEVEFSRVNQEDSKAAATQDSEQGRSLWHVSIPELVKDDERYFRIRFPILHCGRMWTTKRHLALSYGARLDFRVADLREAVGDPLWDSVRDSVMPIEDLQFFAISAWTLQFQNSSPPPYTSRILEGKSWAPYLKRKTRGERMVIYQWNNSFPTHQLAVSPANPFRVFLDLSRETISLSLPAAIQSILAVFLIGAVIASALWWTVGAVDINALKLRWTHYLAGTSILGILVLIFGKIGPAKKVWEASGKALKFIDNWWYSL